MESQEIDQLKALHPRFKELPSSLARAARYERLLDGTVPVLLAHPDWNNPAPVVFWMHGRTAYKELDPGRYLRMIRAGIAVCAIDLPGHGERDGEPAHTPDRTLYAVEQMVGEIDGVFAEVAGGFERLFDPARAAIGGMSAGGMVTLRRLADPHPFRAAAVESTAGDFASMPYTSIYPNDIIQRLDPMPRVGDWEPVPLLALHSEADKVTPVGATRDFTDALAAAYTVRGASPSLVRMVTWPETGAPSEHAGFGRHAAEAKDIQLAFFREHLLGETG